MSLLQKIIISICAANFCALNLSILFFRNSCDNCYAASLFDEMVHYFIMFGFFYTFGFVVSFFFSVTIGGALYWLLNQFTYPTIFSNIFIGCLVATVPFFILNWFGWNLPNISSEIGMVTITALMSCGIIGGVTFSLVGE